MIFTMKLDFGEAGDKAKKGKKVLNSVSKRIIYLRIIMKIIQ